MPSVEPLEKYLEALKSYEAGDKERALDLIAESIGATEPTPIMRQSIKEITKPNVAILALILNRCQKGG